MNETDPHEAYLDAVFAKIDRIRHIDASILTEKYGIDPAVLSPADGEARPSWAVERLLADADAQREELREHLNALTREFVADGLACDAAVLNAQQALGDPEVLAKQMSRSMAQAAVGIDGRWAPWLRSLAWWSWVPYLAILPIDLAIYHLHLPFLLTFTTVIVLCSLIGFLQGYAAGITMTSQLFSLLTNTEHGLNDIRKLPVKTDLSLRQRFHRFQLFRAEQTMRNIRSHSRIAAGDGRICLKSALKEVGYYAFFIGLYVHIMGSVSKIIFCSLYAAELTRDYGCRLGTRRRLALSARRAS